MTVVLAVWMSVLAAVSHAGEPDAGIVGGQPEPGFDTAVSLGADILGDRVSLCTANLITTRILLTAAHCTDFIPPELLAAAGRAYVGADIDEAEYALELVDLAVHPDYVELDNDAGTVGEYDISVVVLAEDAPIRPMWLRLEPITEAAIGAELTSIGFGLDEANVSGVKRSAVLTLDELDDYFLLSSSYTNPNQANICSGDSGGPQVAQVDGRWEQWGVHSWGDSACRTRSGSTRVDTSLEWILDQIEAEHGTRDLCIANGYSGDGVCDPICETQGPIDPDCRADPPALTSGTSVDKGGCAVVSAVPFCQSVLFISAFAVFSVRRSPRHA